MKEKQLDLYTGEPSEYRFAVIFYTPQRGDFSVDVTIPVNDRRVAIATAAQKANLKYYQQASAHILPLKKDPK